MKIPVTVASDSQDLKQAMVPRSIEPSNETLQQMSDDLFNARYSAKLALENIEQLYKDVQDEQRKRGLL